MQAAIDTAQTRRERSFAQNSYRDYNDDNEAYNPQYQRRASSYETYKPGEVFAFDPNTAGDEEWKRMGLTSKTIKTLNNFRSKGGKFYRREDLQKIWGLPDGFYERVKDHISIAAIPKKEFDNTYPKPAYEKYERSIAEVDINEGDSTAFDALPGIGEKLAYRITNFRDKLGGFYSVEQVKETYGLPDSTFQKIKPYLHIGRAAVKKINVNSATKEELKLHPYIRWQLANVIVEYRNQHGAYKSIEELKNIAVIDEAIFQKISPYLSL